MRDADMPVGVAGAGADPAAPTLLTTEREITSPPSSPSLRSSSKSSGCFLDDGALPLFHSPLHILYSCSIPHPISQPGRHFTPASLSISHFL